MLYKGHLNLHHNTMLCMSIVTTRHRREQTIYIYIYIYWNTAKGRQTASTHRKTIVAWLPHKAVKSCPYIQFKTIYSTTIPYSSIKLWGEVLNVSTVFWLTTLSGRLFHSSNVIGKQLYLQLSLQLIGIKLLLFCPLVVLVGLTTYGGICRALMLFTHLQRFTNRCSCRLCCRDVHFSSWSIDVSCKLVNMTSLMRSANTPILKFKTEQNKI